MLLSLLSPFLAFLTIGLWFTLIKKRLGVNLPLPTATLLSLALALINNAIGHFFPPNGLLLTPAVVSAAACLIGTAGPGGKSITKVFLIAFVVSVHDVGTKLYAGGTHDAEGFGFMLLFLFYGLIPSYLMLIILLIRDRQETLFSRITAIILFPLLMYTHLHFSNGLGAGRYYDSLFSY